MKKYYKWYLVHKDSSTIFSGPYNNESWAKHILKYEHEKHKHLFDLVVAKHTLEMEILDEQN